MLGDLELLLMPSWALVFGGSYAKLHIFEPRQLRLVEHRMDWIHDMLRATVSDSWQHVTTCPLYADSSVGRSAR